MKNSILKPKRRSRGDAHSNYPVKLQTASDVTVLRDGVVVEIRPPYSYQELKKIVWKWDKAY